MIQFCPNVNFVTYVIFKTYLIVDIISFLEQVFWTLYFHDCVLDTVCVTLFLKLYFDAVFSIQCLGHCFFNFVFWTQCVSRCFGHSVFDTMYWTEYVGYCFWHCLPDTVLDMYCVLDTVLVTVLDTVFLTLCFKHCSLDHSIWGIVIDTMFW